MIIGGFQKFSLIDYPGKISCIVFTQGCNFRCPYCHNPELIPFMPLVKIKEETILSFLERRKGKIDAVVITGGEPTIHQDLLKFIQKIKEMGYLIKLDTNGSNPEMLEIITYPSWSKRPRCDVLAVVHRDAIDACLTTDAKEIIFDQRAEAELFIGEEQIYCDIELP